MSITLAKIIEESFFIASDKGWTEREIPFPEAIALLHSELSEALEEYRAGRNMSEIYVALPEGAKNTPVIQKPEGIAVELADVLIRLCFYAAYFGIPLEEAYKRKSIFNNLRPHRHGDKKI